MNIERLSASEANSLIVGQFLLKTFAKEHRFGASPTVGVNVDRAWEHIWRLMDEGAVWVAKDSAGAITGSISVEEDVLWWTDRTYLCDGWFYVRPQNRGSAAAVLLLGAAEAYAKEKKMPLVIKVFHAGNPGVIGKFLGRMGFSCLGGTYIKEP